MKSNDLTDIVLTEYGNDNGLTKIFRHLAGDLCLKTVQIWSRMINQTVSIDSSKPSGRARILRTPGVIHKVKNRVKTREKMCVCKLSNDRNISQTSILRILKEDLGYYPYKTFFQPFLTDAHRAERKIFRNCVCTTFRKEQMMNILFSDEKFFDIDGVYNVQNHWVWAFNHIEANKIREVKQKRKFPSNVMV